MGKRSAASRDEENKTEHTQAPRQPEVRFMVPKRERRSGEGIEPLKKG
jgi:hypothetical protein